MPHGLLITYDAVNWLRKYIAEYEQQPISSQEFCLKHKLSKTYIINQKARNTEAWRSLSPREQFLITYLTYRHGRGQLPSWAEVEAAARREARVAAIEARVPQIEAMIAAGEARLADPQSEVPERPTGLHSLVPGLGGVPKFGVVPGSAVVLTPYGKKPGAVPEVVFPAGHHPVSGGGDAARSDAGGQSSPGRRAGQSPSQSGQRAASPGR